MIILFLLLLCVYTTGTCSNLQVIDDFDIFNGEYTSNFDHNGNPEYFRSDGKYNLFLEHENKGCEFNINNLVSDFPFSRSLVSICEISEPIVIESELFEGSKNTTKLQVQLKCLCEKSENTIKMIITYSIVIVVVIIVLFLLGLIITRTRVLKMIKKDTNCDTCRIRDENIKITELNNNA